MPRRHYAAIRISHCERDDCPNPSGDSGLCREHDQEQFERNARYLAAVVDPCRICGEPTHEDRTSCELDRHPIPDSTEEP